MEWLNLRLTQLDAPEFIRSEPVERATWLLLLKFCCGQENSGIIRDCADWKCRTWQQIAGVTLKEVRALTRLWNWDGADLHIWGYPLEKEAILQGKRLAGAQGGVASGRSRRQASAPAKGEAHASPNAPANAEPNGSDMLERKDKEGKEKEGNSTTTTTTRTPEPLSPAVPPQPPLNRGCTLDEAFAFATRHNNGSSAAGFTLPTHVVTLWHDDRSAAGWTRVKEGHEMPIADWQADLRAYAQRYTRNEQTATSRPGGSFRPAPVATPKLTTAAKGGF